MEKSSFCNEQRIRHQFDSFCKMVMHGEKVNYEREMNYRSKHEVSLSWLAEEELWKLNKVDEYIGETETFLVFGYNIEVRDEMIAEALKHLPEKKRNVILLSFFYGYDRYRNCKAYESCQKYHSSSSCKLTESVEKDYGGNSE